MNHATSTIKERLWGPMTNGCVACKLTLWVLKQFVYESWYYNRVIHPIPVAFLCVNVPQTKDRKTLHKITRSTHFLKGEQVRTHFHQRVCSNSPPPRNRLCTPLVHCIFTQKSRSLLPQTRTRKKLHKITRSTHFLKGEQVGTNFHQRVCPNSPPPIW